MFGMSTVWEDTDGCDNQYMCALSIYVLTVLSSLYGVIMDRVINALGRGNIVVDRLDATYKDDNTVNTYIDKAHIY